MATFPGFANIAGSEFWICTPLLRRNDGGLRELVVDMDYTGMYAAVKTIATIISLVFFIDRLGRRKLLITSSIGTCLPLWYIGAFITAQNIDLRVEQEKSVAGWVAIVCVYVYAVSFSIPPLSIQPFTPLQLRLLIFSHRLLSQSHGMEWFGCIALRYSQRALRSLLSA